LYSSYSNNVMIGTENYVISWTYPFATFYSAELPLGVYLILLLK